MGGLTAFLLRLSVLALAVFALIGGAMTLAADRVASPVVPTDSTKQRTIVVPDVQGQVYVFAKGILEDAGLAWKVAGATRGYAANFVQSQTPSPGTVVLATDKPGTGPLVTLALAPNSSVRRKGLPDDTSPYPGLPPRAAPAG